MTVQSDAMPVTADSQAEAKASPSFGEAFWLWFKIGCINFGGPAGQIAMMHRMLVDEKKWIDEPRFLHALNFCMLLPGPEAQKLATYIGWALHGVRGADTARPDLAPEAAGLHAISLGLSAMAGDDDHGMIERGFMVYDALFSWLRYAAEERHNWPAKAA